jgi:O-antigen/teichoic acid export membrane protein
MTATVIQSAINFFLIPVYARNLSKAEFGAMDQILQFIAIVQLLASVGLPLGMVRGFYLAANNEETRRRMAGVLFNFVFPVTLLVSLGIFLFAGPLSNLIFAGNGKVEWIQWSVVLIVITSVSGLPMAMLRTLQASKAYALWSVVMALINASATVALLLGPYFSLTNLIIVNCVSSAVIAAAIFPRFLKYARLNVRLSLLSPMFAFGVPLLPSSLARKALEVSGRYMLPHFCGLAEVGTFTMGLKIALILDTLVLFPFSNAWMPYFYSQSKNPDAPVLFARITGLAVMALCFIILAIEAIKPFLLSLLGGGRFADSSPVVSALLLGIGINGVQYTVSPGIHLSKKLVHDAVLMVLSAAVCILLNALLIPRFHSTGAALAIAGGYGFYLCTTFFLSRHYYPIGYPWKNIVITIITAAGCWCAISNFDNIIVRVLLVGIFAGVCVSLDPSLLSMTHNLQGKIFNRKVVVT